MSKVLELTPPNDALYKPKAFDFDNPFMDPKELARLVQYETLQRVVCLLIKVLMLKYSSWVKMIFV